MGRTNGDTKKIQLKPGWLLATFIASLPCIYLLYLEYPLFTANFNYLMRLGGRLSALFGISLFSLTFLLNTRLGFLEDMFGGLDKTYKAHRIFGTIAFLSLLAHPMLIAGTYASISVAAAAGFLLTANDFPILLGTLGLLTMESFLIFTFFAKVKRQNWKFVHRLLGISFFLGSLHTMLVPGAVMSNVLIRSYLFLMISIGFISYVYRTVLWMSLVKRHSYVIEGVNQLDNSIIELTLAPENEAISLSFSPGQFIFISLDSGISSGEPHPFTVSSSAYDKKIRLAIKSLGDFTSDLKYVKTGTKVKVEGPYGRFIPAAFDKKDQIWIAGGIGVTPFLSAARSMGNKKIVFSGETGAMPFVRMAPAVESFAPVKIDMYYCAKDEKDALFLNELNSISSKNKNLKIIPFFSSMQGRICGKHILSASKNLKNKEIFICGPPAMMQALKFQLLEMGVPGASIHMEEFEL